MILHFGESNQLIFVINSLEGGGAERVLCNWLSELENDFINARVDVFLILLDSAERKNQPPPFVKVIELDSNGGLISSFFNLKKRMSIMNPGLVVSFLTRSNIVSTMVCRASKVPVIISERVNTSQHFANTAQGIISKFLIKHIYPRADEVLAVSEGVKNDLVSNYGLDKSKCVVVHNGYDIESLELKASSGMDKLTVPAKYAIAIGRLVVNKNFELLIKAYAKSNIDIPLLILGEGPVFQALDALIQELSQQSNITLLGYVENPYPLLKGASFLVSTSNAEGFPNGIAESLCLGVPVLATNCESGPAEIIAQDSLFSSNGPVVFKYGILIPTNDLSATVDGLEQMYSNVERFDEQNIKNRAADFSFVRLRENLLQILTRYST